jgi:hypothetical protein
MGASPGGADRLTVLGFSGIALFVALIVWLSVRHPYRQQKLVGRTWFWNDLIWYALVQSFVSGALIASFVVFVDGKTGWSRHRLVSN